ncbi:MAG TPA: sugar ABC transporter permease [Candidatus Limnocylindrales bacterium]|jgi:multiple sugar transport system permease protein
MAMASSSASASRSARQGGWWTTRRRSRQLLGLLYVAPTVIFVAVFFIAPLVLVANMSASHWTLLGGNKGFNLPDNYSAIADSSLFWPAVVFTLEYTVLATVLLVGMGLGLALLIQSGGKWKGFLRTAFLLPSAMGLASASLLFYGLYSNQIGPLNPILQAMHLTSSPIQFLEEPLSALWWTTFLIVWRFAGFYMLILLVGLQAIPRDLFEAAAIDGANRWETFRSITVPLLRRSLALSLILCITGSMLAFDQFYILTQGGPDNSTITIVQLIYHYAFQSQNLGIAAALSVVLLAILLVVNAVQFGSLRGAEDFR